MEVNKIFFDMDGVLADFDRGVVELLGLPVLPQANRDRKLVTELWEHVKLCEHYYDRLELIPGAKELFDDVYTRYGDRCEILTGLPKPWRHIDTAAEDKIRWVRRLLSPDIVIHTVLREEKADFCTGPDCILIDDLGENIDIWQEHGGTGVCFVSAAETSAKLRSMGLL